MWQGEALARLHNPEQMLQSMRTGFRTLARGRWPGLGNDPADGASRYALCILDSGTPNTFDNNANRHSDCCGVTPERNDPPPRKGRFHGDYLGDTRQEDIKKMVPFFNGTITTSSRHTTHLRNDNNLPLNRKLSVPVKGVRCRGHNQKHWVFPSSTF